ncbi:hypothetical protein C0J52_12458 [Blattella germanica]|nr:hypothetical protein C0J52_12458 [Blattella germanica]
MHNVIHLCTSTSVVTRRDTIKNTVITEDLNIEEIKTDIENITLQWYGHVMHTPKDEAKKGRDSEPDVLTKLGQTLRRERAGLDGDASNSSKEGCRWLEFLCNRDWKLLLTLLWPHHEKSRGLDAQGKRGFSLLSHTHYSKNINSLTY